MFERYKPRGWSGFGLLIFICILFLFCSCARQKQAPTEAELAESEAIRVPLVQLCETRLEDELRPQTFSAIAKEGKTIQLSFRVPGPLVSMTAKVGEMVEEGTELARLDQRDFLNTLETVKAGLAEVQAALDAKTANKDRSITMLQKQVDAAVTQFETVDKNLKKFTELEKDGAVPEIKLDEIKLQHEQALAAKIAAEKQLENGIKGLDEEIKGYEAKKKGLLTQQTQAENALKDTVLVAPCRGYVTQKYSENNEIVAPGIPVLAFTDASSILVQTTISESFLVRQNEFTSFECVFEAYPDVKFNAELDSLGKALQAGGHGYPLEVVIKNEDPERKIYPGMAASLTINFKPREGECLVPLMSIVGDYVPPAADSSPEDYTGKSTETVVWTLSPENKVVKREVQIVRLTAEGVVVTGLNPGEKIVGPGARFLREGQTVRTR